VSGGPLIIGVGNPWRGDDAAGIEVALRVGGLAFEGDGTGLVDAWAGADDVVIVDAAAPGTAPGTVHRFDASTAPLPAHRLRSSSHHFGVADAIELARALDRLPPVLRVYAIEGEDFGAGRKLSPPVRRAVEALVAELEVG
jgi:hydrogenase maturation protease